MSITEKKPRMEWLDAMRGFTMLLVVANHVSTIGFGEHIKTSTSLSLLMLFRMPLFFFLSGFLCYKASYVWTRRSLADIVWKKFKVQVIPTIVFLLLAVCWLHKDFTAGLEAALASPYKDGYWFCWVLLQMFVAYYLFAWLESKLPQQRPWPVIALWAAALGVYATVYMPHYFTYHKADFFQYTSLIQTMIYFHFFLFGNIVKRHWAQAERLMDSRWLMPAVCLVAILCTTDIMKWHTLRGQWTNLPRTLSMYSLLILVILFFRHYREHFSRQTRLGHTLQYIGVRTLDVYLLHYFFLPHVSEVGRYLNTHSVGFVADTTLSLLAALLVVGFCLLCSSLLRISPFLKLWLFGRK